MPLLHSTQLSPQHLVLAALHISEIYVVAVGRGRR